MSIKAAGRHQVLVLNRELATAKHEQCHRYKLSSKFILRLNLLKHCLNIRLIANSLEAFFLFLRQPFGNKPPPPLPLTPASGLPHTPHMQISMHLSICAHLASGTVVVTQGSGAAGMTGACCVRCSRLVLQRTSKWTGASWLQLVLHSKHAVGGASCLSVLRMQMTESSVIT